MSSDDGENKIVTLENIDEINENCILKAPKKGKLKKGPNWTAYKRENLGTIPGNTEKVLIQEPSKLDSVAFLSQTGRFRGLNNIKLNPGPGSYDLRQNLNLVSSSHSSKGLGNGFVSTSERFDQANLYYEKFYPGPGQYKSADKVSIEHDLEKSFKYKSLYGKSKINSLKIKTSTPGPGFYNPEMCNDTVIKGSLSVFTSSVTRFRQKNQSDYPGPGKYFEQKGDDSDTVDGKGKTLSFFFRKSKPRKTDPILKYIKATEKKTESLEQDLNYDYNKVFKRIKNRKNNNANILAQKNILSIVKGSKDKTDNGNNSANANMAIDKTSAFKEVLRTRQLQEEAQIINDLLGKTKKKSMFEFSPPRWKEKTFTKHFPGPAYYNPVMVRTKSEFYNESLNRWLL